MRFNFIFETRSHVSDMLIRLLTRVNWRSSPIVVLAFGAARAGGPAEALVWTAGPSDPSSLLLIWF